MEELWKAAFSVAGVAGVAFFVLLSVYQGWLKVSWAKKLTSKQLFVLLMTTLVLTFLSCIAGLLTYARENDHSLRELTNLLQQRENDVVSLFNQRESELSAEGKSTDVLKAVKARFLRLSADVIAAFGARNFVAAQTTISQIDQLLQSEEVRNLFTFMKPVYETRMDDNGKTYTVGKLVPESRNISAEYFAPAEIKDVPPGAKPILNEFNAGETAPEPPSSGNEP